LAPSVAKTCCPKAAAAILAAWEITSLGQGSWELGRSWGGAGNEAGRRELGTQAFPFRKNRGVTALVQHAPAEI